MTSEIEPSSSEHEECDSCTDLAPCVLVPITSFVGRGAERVGLPSDVISLCHDCIQTCAVVASKDRR